MITASQVCLFCCHSKVIHSPVSGDALKDKEFPYLRLKDSLSTKISFFVKVKVRRVLVSFLKFIELKIVLKCRFRMYKVMFFS